jgi:hypothetical protein
MGNIPPNKIHDEELSLSTSSQSSHVPNDSTSMMGKQIHILSKIKIPDKGQGTDTYGLQFVYFEKKYIIAGKLTIQCKDVNEQHRQILGALGLDVSASQSYHTLYVICDCTHASKKLPDPPYIHPVGVIKYISGASLSKCITNTHHVLI